MTFEEVELSLSLRLTGQVGMAYTSDSDKLFLSDAQHEQSVPPCPRSPTETHTHQRAGRPSAQPALESSQIGARRSSSRANPSRSASGRPREEEEAAPNRKPGSQRAALSSAESHSR